MTLNFTKSAVPPGKIPIQNLKYKSQAKNKKEETFPLQKEAH